MSNVLPNDEHPIVRLDGIPIEPLKHGEPSLWHRFWANFTPWVNPRLKKAERLAERYGAAAVGSIEGDGKIKRATAQKTAEEAAEIAAHVEHQRLQDVGVKLDLIDRAFGRAPDLADVLKAETVLNSFPELAEQANRVRVLMNDLAQRRETEIEIVTDPKLLESELARLESGAESEAEEGLRRGGSPT